MRSTTNCRLAFSVILFILFSCEAKLKIFLHSEKKSWRTCSAIMETILINLLITLAAFFSMEGVAWFTHKYVMHGMLWALHKDHHKKESDGFFEHNDFFFLVFALPGI